MAPLFNSKAQKKMVPNGGLGGLVCPGRETIVQTLGTIGAKPVRKIRRQPPPLQISVGCEHFTASPAQFSPASSLGLGGLFTPKTPTDRRQHSLLGNDTGFESSPTSSRCATAIPNNMFSPPETPISPQPISLAELPGSLLLASQGFLQSLPISPPPSLRLLRRDTEGSIISSTPSLSTSVSTEEETMETLRHLTARKHDRPHRDMPASYTIGSRTPAVAKPFAVMTMEELLDTLPECDHSVISQNWLPAMRMQIEKMISVLNEAGNLQIDRSVDQVTLHNASGSTCGSDSTANVCQVLKTFSNQMRAITADYHKVVDAAESLAERDTKVNDERVAGLEERVNEAMSSLEAKDREIEDRDNQVLALRNTCHDITRLLGTFIETHLPSWVDTMTDPRTQQVMHIVADYTRENPSSVDYVRVPEHTFNKYASDLRDSRNLVGEFRKVLQGQSAMIKDQSQNLDAHVDKYEQAVKLVQEKDHEILLLVQHNDGLARQLQDTQAALAERQDAAAEAEITGRRYDELRGNMQSLKTAHELELDQKDAEIANIRQKLGSAREEVFARREDVRNVVAQSQALRQTQQDPHASALAAASRPSSSTSKALRFFGMERDKLKKGNITSSHSTLGLSSVDARFSSKEVAPAVSKETLRYRPSLQTRGNPGSARTAPNTPVITFQGSSGFTGEGHATRPFSDSRHAPPRSDSLGVPQHYTSNPTTPVAPVDIFKPLPDNPMSMSHLATARLAGVTAPIESPLQAQITSDYLSHGIMGQTAQSARRVLSRITEVSTPMSRRSEEDDQGTKLELVHEDDGSDHSVASSDRKIYRTSISALDMLNSSSNFPYSETETDTERIMRATGIAAGTGSPQARSINRRTTDTRANAQQMQEEDYEDARTGVARVLHVRPGNRDLRRAGGTHDGIAEEDNPRDPHAHRRHFGVIGDGRVERRPLHPRDRESSGESTQDRRERFRNPARESLVSNESSAGYRTEDSEPKTVAQMYHAGGKHIRG